MDYNNITMVRVHGVNTPIYGKIHGSNIILGFSQLLHGLNAWIKSTKLVENPWIQNYPWIFTTFSWIVSMDWMHKTAGKSMDLILSMDFTTFAWIESMDWVDQYKKIHGSKIIHELYHVWTPWSETYPLTGLLVNPKI